jgi:hypothetical protein
MYGLCAFGSWDCGHIVFVVATRFCLLPFQNHAGGIPSNQRDNNIGGIPSNQRDDNINV